MERLNHSEEKFVFKNKETVCLRFLLVASLSGSPGVGRVVWRGRISRGISLNYYGEKAANMMLLK